MAVYICSKCNEEKKVDFNETFCEQKCSCGEVMEAKKELKEMAEEKFNEFVYGTEGIVILFLYLEGDKHSVEALPVMEKLNSIYEEELEVFKVNGEKNPMLIKGFMIRALPSLILFSNGRLMDVKTGVGNYEKTLNFIRRTIMI